MATKARGGWKINCEILSLFANAVLMRVATNARINTKSKGEKYTPFIIIS